MEFLIPKELKATNDVSDISQIGNEETAPKIEKLKQKKLIQDYNNRTPNSKVPRPFIKTQENNDEGGENYETNSNITNDLLQVRKYKLKDIIKKKVYDENNINENIDIPHKEITKTKKDKILLLLPEPKTKGVVKKENTYFVKQKIINKKDKKERFDRNGIVINKINKRKVHVTFIDRITSNSLTDVIKIESFKKYNVILGIPKEDKYIGAVRKNCQCCNIF